MHQRIERRQREQCEERRGDQPADHHDGERTLDLRSVEAEEQQRKEAEDRRRGGEELRPDPPDARLAERVVEGHALFEKSAGLRDQHEAVLHGDAEEGSC